jgi:signal transduction histidine kinase
MRRIPIRTKVMAALALPLVALTLVTFVEVRDALHEEREVSDETRMARAATGPNGLFTSLQNERNRAAVDLVGQGAIVALPVENNAEARELTDKSLAQFQDVVDTAGGAAETAYEPALSKLTELEAIRADIDGNAGPYTLEDNSVFANDIFTRYTDIVGELLTANTRLSSSIDNQELRRGADLSYMASFQTDVLAQLTRTLLLSIPTDGLDSRDEKVAAAGPFRLAVSNLENIESLAVDEYKPLADKLVEAEHSRGLLDRIAPTALETGHVDAGQLLQSVSADDDGYLYTFRDEVKQVLDAKADEIDGAASRRMWNFLAGATAVLALAGLATWLVSRSITRPLRHLTRQADDMAHHKLPEAVQDILDTPLGDDVVVSELDPIGVRSNDEVADVSGALNTVQDSALQLAVEQALLRRNIADSFINLGRRNQNLLSRQLDFITELEQNETDPTVLADLFRLDHLATRMRRNAESLLVLAGIDPPRQWAAPVRIQDVIRAALGEVEDYQRVTVRAVEPVTVLGSAAADLAHLIAELVENALIFSPPDQSVEIRGRLQTLDAAAGSEGYTLAVIDYGMGMPPDELAQANRRLAGSESFTVAPSKYLGHYVAGNLAARHDIAITLHNSPSNGTTHPGATGSGITALVRLPCAVLMAPEEPELPAAPPDEPRELVGVGAGPLSPSPDAPVGPRRTASGLVRRTRQAAAPAPDIPLPTDVVEALAQHTRPTLTPAAPPAPASWPPPQPAATPGPATAPVSPPTAPDGEPDQTASGLIRRVRGAQLPKTETVSLRRGTGENAPETPSSPPPPPPPGPDTLANLLGDFTAGIQRGLDETAETPRVEDE